jgi:hypothetical protein
MRLVRAVPASLVLRAERLAAPSSWPWPWPWRARAAGRGSASPARALARCPGGLGSGWRGRRPRRLPRAGRAGLLTSVCLGRGSAARQAPGARLEPDVPRRRSGRPRRGALARTGWRAHGRAAGALAPHPCISGGPRPWRGDPRRRCPPWREVAEKARPPAGSPCPLRAWGLLPGPPQSLFS